MTRTEKRLEILKKQADETEARIRADTETLNRLKEEIETLTAKKISEFAKSQNLVIDDKFFEMLSMVSQIQEEGKKTEEIKVFVTDTEHPVTGKTITASETKEEKFNDPF